MRYSSYPFLSIVLRCVTLIAHFEAFLSVCNALHFSTNQIACKIVALSLHYLYMAAFAWMCCEGIHLYTKVIEVFSSETSKMKYYYMLGWGK